MSLHCSEMSSKSHGTMIKEPAETDMEEVIFQPDVKNIASHKLGRYALMTDRQTSGKNCGYRLPSERYRTLRST